LISALGNPIFSSYTFSCRNTATWVPWLPNPQHIKVGNLHILLLIFLKRWRALVILGLVANKTLWNPLFLVFFIIARPSASHRQGQRDLGVALVFGLIDPRFHLGYGHMDCNSSLGRHDHLVSPLFNLDRENRYVK
jgi:hypothetical protein